MQQPSKDLKDLTHSSEVAKAGTARGDGKDRDALPVLVDRVFGNADTAAAEPVPLVANLPSGTKLVDGGDRETELLGSSFDG